MTLRVGRQYRPIEGEVTGELVHIDIVTNEVQWMHRDTVFIIPYERFVEYFCETA